MSAHDGGHARWLGCGSCLTVEREGTEERKETSVIECHHRTRNLLELVKKMGRRRAFEAEEPQGSGHRGLMSSVWGGSECLPLASKVYGGGESLERRLTVKAKVTSGP